FSVISQKTAHSLTNTHPTKKTAHRNRLFRETKKNLMQSLLLRFPFFGKNQPEATASAKAEIAFDE
ncbi:MAG: hypothetical protein SVP52_03455, partial [Chloroflexota bacterium]|nr:hypothetical protein [Chloroflexota bacterium]